MTKKERNACNDEVRKESEVFKRLAFSVVFLSPELKQLEYKGNYMLGRLWEVLKTRYVDAEPLSGEEYQILPRAEALEIESVSNRDERARLVCDFLAGLTDSSAVRMYKRLFVPDFGSIGDWVG